MIHHILTLNSLPHRLSLSLPLSLTHTLALTRSQVYKTFPHILPQLFRWLSKRTKICIPIFHGRGGTPLPFKHPIRVLVGAPIPVPVPDRPGGKPDDALVDEYHAKYVAALKALYAKYATEEDVPGGKEKNDEARRQLEILDSNWEPAAGC